MLKYTGFGEVLNPRLRPQQLGNHASTGLSTALQMLAQMMKQVRASGNLSDG